MSLISEEEENWISMLQNEIDIREIPIEFLAEIEIEFEDSSITIFDIISLLSHTSSIRLEKNIKKFMLAKHETIKSVDYRLNLNAVATTVSKKVREILD
jgi:hypothetical protein